MTEKLLQDLNDQNSKVRLDALNELAKNVNVFDKSTVVKALKPLILDWDEDVRVCVAKVLDLYIGS